MLSNAREIHRRARQNALLHGLLRTETLVVLFIALFLVVLTLFNWLWFPDMWWVWLVLGFGGATLLALSTASDKLLIRSFVREKLDAHIKTSQIHVPELQAGVAKAMYQHRALSKMLLERSENLDKVMELLDDWVLLVYDIAQGLENVLKDPKLIRQTQEALGELESTELIQDPVNAVVTAADRVAPVNRSHQLVLTRDVIMRARNDLGSALDQAITVNTALRRARGMRMDTTHITQIEAVLELQLMALTEAQDAVQHLMYTYKTR
jgi:hypothetical protein